MCQPNTPSNITKTNGLTHETKIILRIQRLHLPLTFPSLRDILASVHPVHPWLPGHGSVRPCLCFGDADNGGSNPVQIWAVEVEKTAYLPSGRGNDYICWSLRHNF
uniref:AC5b n=1 Tax=Croton yellow vein mosaic virus TaxID=207697 RepID=A0A5J6AAY6_9GEMI|nr:AC5b [Croton yellow vein mosaic virus]